MLDALQRMTHRLRRASGADQTRADRALADRLRRRFERDLSLAAIEGLHLYVRDSAVTIYGTVPHALDHDLVVSIVRQTSGVEDVVSHLAIDEAPNGR